MVNERFNDRRAAGIKLAGLLRDYEGNPETVVLGLPRGGVVVAFEVSQALHLPLDVVISRKIGAPGNPEFAIGAISEDGVNLLEESTVRYYQIPHTYIASKSAAEIQEALRRAKLYRNGEPPMDLSGKCAILVDDGIATGATMRVAVRSARQRGAREVVVAVPVLSAGMVGEMEKEADRVVYVQAPQMLFAVGSFYESFEQVSDDEVITLLNP